MRGNLKAAREVIGLVVAMTLGASGLAYCQVWREILPRGEISFPDAVVEYNIPGGPFGIDRVEDILNPPNYVEPGRGDAVTLGCGGYIIVRFDDNAVIDVPGTDLHIWEVGPPFEPTSFSLSNDGRVWENIG